MMENDPFFSMYRPALSQEESEDQLSLALSESASMSSSLYEEPIVSSGPRTVWGTRQVTSREEELIMNQSNDWADHIVINKSQRKKRGKKH